MGQSMPSTEIRMKNMICWECGKTFEANATYRRCYCDVCSTKHKDEIANNRKQMVYLKKFFMLERAMEILEKQSYDFNKHREEIKAVQDKFWDDPDKFDSADEIVTAIILVEHRIYAKLQYKIDRYQVDFLIPDYHVILEIDGDRHRYNVGRDSVRDEAIKYILGDDWEIIRIPTKYIETDASKLIVAIDKVLEVRENDGKINWRKIYN